MTADGMTGHRPDVLHVLTVHYNTPELTSRLVASFPDRTPAGREIRIHVLDNASDPENVQQLRNAIGDIPRATLDISQRNLGFGEGINRLANRGDIAPSHTIWLLNPDTLLEPGCLEALESELDRGHFAAVSPLIFSGDGAGRWIWYCGGDLSVAQLRVQHRHYGSPLSAAEQHPFETEFVTGAAPVMRAATFLDVGGFRRGYFMYWEDAYFSWQVRQQGLRLGVIPSARLWHAVGASSGYGQSQLFYYWTTRNRFRFAADIGLSRWQVITGRRGVECFRPLAHALREKHGRFSKFSRAMRGTIDGFLDTQRTDG